MCMLRTGTASALNTKSVGTKYQQNARQDLEHCKSVDWPVAACFQFDRSWFNLQVDIWSELQAEECSRRKFKTQSGIASVLCFVPRAPLKAGAACLSHGALVLVIVVVVDTKEEEHPTLFSLSLMLNLRDQSGNKATVAIYLQLAAAVENLKHIFNVPESVKRTQDLINDGKLLHAHKQ